MEVPAPVMEFASAASLRMEPKDLATTQTANVPLAVVERVAFATSLVLRIDHNGLIRHDLDNRGSSL